MIHAIWKRAGALGAVTALLLGLFSTARAAETAPKPLDVAQILAQVRLATHLGLSSAAKSDLVLTGTTHFEGVDQTYRLQFNPAGPFVETLTGRLGQTTGFDGKTAWQVDHTALPLVLEGQDRETALLVAWVTDGHWAATDSPLIVSLLPDKTTDAQAALSVKFPGGTLDARLLVDRTTWLPAALFYTKVSGAQAWQFTDYHTDAGLVLPHQWSHRDNDITDTVQIQSVSTAAHTNTPFAPVTVRPKDAVFDPAVSPQIEVKRNRAGDVLVHPIIDGKDIGWFLLDTGTNVMGLQPSAAEGLKLTPFGEKSESGAGTLLRSAFHSARTLRLGPLTMTNPLFEEIDVSNVAAYSNVPVVGVCGYDLFARAVVELNMQEGTGSAALFDPIRYRLSTGAWQPLSLDYRVPSVRCRFEGEREGVFGLDTGYSDIAIFFPSAVANLGLLQGRSTTATRIEGFGGGFTNRRGVLSWIEVGGQRFDNQYVTFSQAAVGDFSNTAFTGYVGQTLLGAFTVVFDYPNRRIAFLPHQTR